MDHSHRAPFPTEAGEGQDKLEQLRVLVAEQLSGLRASTAQRSRFRALNPKP